MDQDLEGELGIDTVKQAEIMAEVRDIFSLPVDEDFVLSDHPTLNHFTAYIVKMSGGETEIEPDIPVVEQSNDEEIVDEQLPIPAIASQTHAEPKNTVSGCRRWQVEIEECLGVDERLSLIHI